MTEYEVSNIDPNVLATVSEELNRREEQQRRHYSYLNELQTLARELPSKYQQRLSSDLLVGLATSLLDGTVFQIVTGIADIQAMEEETLCNMRKKLMADLSDEKRALIATHKDRLYKCNTSPHNRTLVEKQNKDEYEAFERRRQEEITNCDKRIIERMDAKVRDQQKTLMKAGVAGFYQTDDPEAIKLQMYILDFITRLSSAGI